jgi:transketolase
VVGQCPVPVRIIGIPDLYAAVGPTSELRAKYGLTWENIAATAKDLLGSKRDGR